MPIFFDPLSILRFVLEAFLFSAFATYLSLTCADRLKRRAREQAMAKVSKPRKKRAAE